MDPEIHPTETGSLERITVWAPKAPAVTNVAPVSVASRGAFSFGGNKVRRKIATSIVATGAATALALSTVGSATASPTTGVTKNQIVIGTTTPLTGPASPGYKDVAPAAKAYFDYVNANGGINGRNIKYVVFDDQYNPALTKRGTSQLILRDKIFAMFGALGTPTHSAVVADLNRRKIPDVFVNTGAAGFDNPRRYPMTFPYFPSYVVEAKAMGFFMENDPSLRGAKKCLFFQDGEFGENAEIGFKAAGISFDTTVSYFSGQQAAPFTAQVSRMANAGCELVVFFGVTSATAQLLGTAARANFRPTWMITSVGSDPSVLGASLGANTNALLNGVYTPSFLVPIQDEGNAYVRQMKTIAQRNNLPWNFYTYYGINTAYVLAQAIKAAGPDLTRPKLINALETKASSFRSAANVPMRISKTSHQGLTGYWMGQYNNGQLERKTNFIITATSAPTGKAQRATFRPGAPTPKLLP
jgi:branched-chain amino acid transport system substrate-binding protein